MLQGEYWLSDSLCGLFLFLLWAREIVMEGDVSSFGAHCVFFTSCMLRQALSQDRLQVNGRPRYGSRSWPGSGAGGGAGTG